MRWLAAAVVVGAMTVVTATTVHDYFWTWRGHWLPRLVYYPAMTDASIAMLELPEDTQIYFYSERASINLETRQFLAPDVTGTDRSREFGPDEVSIAIDDASRPAAFVLLGPYVDEMLPRLRERYPGASVRVLRGGDTDGVVVVEVKSGQ